MNRTSFFAILALVILGAGAHAQEAQPGGDETRQAPAAGQPGEDGEALPEIDVWEDTEGAEDDVFVPTESISADASIAFPSDI